MEYFYFTSAIMICGLLVSTVAMAQTSQKAEAGGWQARPEVIRSAPYGSSRIYEESKVPAYSLPDVLMNKQGQRITTPAAWSARRIEVLGMFESQMFGRSPGRPASLRFEVIEENPKALEGQATLKKVAIHSGHQGKQHQFVVSLFLPNATPTPAPLFLLININGREHTDTTRKQISERWPVEQAIARGFAIAAFEYGDVAPDDANKYRQGVIQLFENTSEPQADDAWGALAAWAWGASRAMDYFETENRIDKTRIAVVGHSRGGKAALWAGATDERFTLVISNNSGCGGAALSRRQFGETVAHINKIFPHWFCKNFKAYGGHEDNLPFDQHMLLALIAPRAVYVASADEDLWADPRGEFLSLAHVSPVYALWGHKPIAVDEMPALDTPVLVWPRGYHIRTGKHRLTQYDWQQYMNMMDQLTAQAKGPRPAQSVP